MKKISKHLSIRTILLGAIAGAVLLRIVLIARREFWYDEVLSLLLSTGQKSLYQSQSPQDVPVLLSDYGVVLNLPVERSIGDVFATGEKLLKGLAAEPHPPLFYLGQHLWLRLWGNSVAAVRSLNVLYSIGAIACAYGIGGRLLSRRGGLLFAALLGLNPFFLFHSLNVRMYCPLVFWTVLTTWAMLEIIHHNRWWWSLIFIAGVTAGLMTFYYFACYLVALAVLVLWLDPRHWWQHGIRMTLGAVITTPWLLWGTTQQLRNADLGRFKSADSVVEAIGRHTEAVLQVLGIHLIVGDWASVLPPMIITLAGLVAIAALIWASIILYRQAHIKLLGIGLILGILPLLLLLAADVIGGKFTLSFGFGRSVVFILPGCLFLITAATIRGLKHWQPTAIVILVALYLTINLADFSFRPRLMFDHLAAIVRQKPDTPTLVAINTQAWGHVLRLAYYLPSDSPVFLLAQPTSQLPPVLETNLASQTYPRLIWLDAAKPVWGPASTVEQRQQIEQILADDYQLVDSHTLTGTWELDHFTAKVYQSF